MTAQISDRIVINGSSYALFAELLNEYLKSANIKFEESWSRLSEQFPANDKCFSAGFFRQRAPWCWV
jgi:hypothetical protein